MLKLIVLSILISSVWCKGGIEDNNAVETFYGKYKLLYIWPKTRQRIENCTEATYSKMEYYGSEPFKCDCNRQSPNLAFVKQDTLYIGYGVLVDIVQNSDEAAQALQDTCKCSPLNKSRTVFMKVNEDFMLHYEQEDILRMYLFGKRIPDDTEMQGLLASFTDLKDKEGMLVCKA